jgi:hypothetical protein
MLQIINISVCGARDIRLGVKDSYCVDAVMSALVTPLPTSHRLPFCVAGPCPHIHANKPSSSLRNYTRSYGKDVTHTLNNNNNYSIRFAKQRNNCDKTRKNLH